MKQKKNTIKIKERIYFEIKKRAQEENISITKYLENIIIKGLLKRY